MKMIQEILGHASYQLTADTYSHVLPALKQEAAAAMDSLFASQGWPGHLGALCLDSWRGTAESGANGQTSESLGPYRGFSTITQSPSTSAG